MLALFVITLITMMNDNVNIQLSDLRNDIWPMAKQLDSPRNRFGGRVKGGVGVRDGYTELGLRVGSGVEQEFGSGSVFDIYRKGRLT